MRPGTTTYRATYAGYTRIIEKRKHKPLKRMHHSETTMNAYQFFLKNQSGNPDPAERIRIARALSDAERKARDAGYCYSWLQYRPNGLWACAMIGHGGLTILERDSIEFEDGSSPFGNPGRRLIEAEIFLEFSDQWQQQHYRPHGQPHIEHAQRKTNGRKN